MGNQLIDYENNMKNMVPPHILKKRQEVCNECQYKGSNNFCQKNAQWLVEYVKYRYHSCPAGIWVDGWSSN